MSEKDLNLDFEKQCQSGAQSEGIPKIPLENMQKKKKANKENCKT